MACCEKTQKPQNSNVSVRIEHRHILFNTLQGGGSGFFVKPDKVVTNIHAIVERKSILITSVDRERAWKVEGVVAYDLENDLAILKVTDKGIPLLLSNSDVLQKDEPISIFGFPYGKFKVTEGFVYGFQESEKWFKIKPNLSDGYSGSPVLNEKRHVIGVIVSSLVSRDNRELHSVAISLNALKALLDRVEEPAEPLRKWRRRKLIRSFAKLLKGKQNFWNRRYRKAITDFNRAIQLNPKLSEAYWFRAEAKVELDDREGAIIDYNNAIQLGPEDASLYNDRGCTKSELGDLEGAIKDYDSAIQLNPENTRFYENRGRTKSGLGDFEGAISDYDNAIQLDPENAAAYRNRGRAKSKLDDFEGAISDYDNAIQLDPENAELYNTRGVAKSMFQDYDEAITDYNKAIELNPEYTIAYRNRCVLQSNAGASEAAQGNLERAQNLYQAAVEGYTAVIKLDPEDAGSYRRRGQVISEIGTLKAIQGDIAEAQRLYETAIEDHTQAIKKDAKYSDAYNSRAWTRYLLGKSNTSIGNIGAAGALYHAAIIDSNKAIKLDPEAAFYHTRGAAKAAMDNSIGAIEDFDITLQIDPRDALTYYDRALAKQALGQQDTANADFEKARTLDPDIEIKRGIFT